MHRNIRPGAILVARGFPVTSRLTGFSEALSATSAVEAVGDPDFRAPEMSGNQGYDQLVDVFSLSKVIQHCPRCRESFKNTDRSYPAERACPKPS